MRLRDFCAGLVVGLVAGWGVSVVIRAAPEAAPTRPPTVEVPPSDAVRVSVRGQERRRDEPPKSPTETSTATAVQEDRSAILATGDARAIGRVTAPNAELSEAEVRIVAERLSAAQAAGDRELYIRLLEILARSATGGARQKLVELLGDTSIPLGTLKTNLYGDFDRWLENAGVVPGLAAAARKRYDAESQASSWTIGLGLTQMIGRHGDATDLAWLESKAGDGRVGSFALRAIPLCNDPAVEATVERLWGTRRSDAEWLAEYAARRPQAAIAFATRLLKQADSGQEVPNAGGLFDVLGRAAVASKDAAAVSELVATLRTPALRVAAVRAVQRLHDAKMDVSAFAPLLEEPIRLLESGEWETQKIEVRYLVEYHHLLWTPRVAAALETAADRTQDKSAAEGFRHVARLIRDSLTDPWRAK